MKITANSTRRRYVRTAPKAVGPLSKLQKRAVYALLRDGLTKQEIAQLLTVTVPQVSACAAHRTMGHVA